MADHADSQRTLLNAVKSHDRQTATSSSSRPLNHRVPDSSDTDSLHTATREVADGPGTRSSVPGTPWTPWRPPGDPWMGRPLCPRGEEVLEESDLPVEVWLKDPPCRCSGAACWEPLHKLSTFSLQFFSTVTPRQLQAGKRRALRHCVCMVLSPLLCGYGAESAIVWVWCWVRYCVGMVLSPLLCGHGAESASVWVYCWVLYCVGILLSPLLCVYNAESATVYVWCWVRYCVFLGGLAEERTRTGQKNRDGSSVDTPVLTAPKRTIQSPFRSTSLQPGLAVPPTKEDLLISKHDAPR